jgi:MFS family permease
MSPPGPIARLSYQMARLLVLFITAFLDMVGLAMVLPLLPYYAMSMGVNAATVGILVSAFSLAQLACAPLWGRFSDRCGRRPAIVAGLVITAGAYFLFAVADSVALLLASRIVQGVGGGTLGVVQAYVSDATRPEDRTKSLGWLSAVTSLGAVVGPAFGSVLVTTAGRQAPGFAAAGLSALVALFGWKYLRETEIVGATAEHRVPRTAPRSGSMVRVITRWHEPVHRRIWIYAIAIGAFYGTVPTMPLLLVQRLGITEQTVGYVIMYLGMMGVIVRTLVLGRMVDRFGEERLSRIGVVLLAAGLALFGATTDYALLVASLTLMPLGTAFLFPCISGQLSRLVSRRERGFYMGVQHTFGGVSRVAFPIGAGVVMDGLGLGVPFYVAGGLVLATLWLGRSAAARRRIGDAPTTEGLLALPAAPEPSRP